MKILFLTTSLEYGGAERTIVYLSDFFVKNNIDVTILCLTDNVLYDINPKVKIICAGVPDHFGSCFGRLYNMIQRIRVISCYTRSEKPDIVFCMISSQAKYFMWRKSRPYKLMVSERSNPLTYDTKTQKLLNNIYKKCDGVVFQTSRVSSLYPNIPDHKKKVIPNAIGNKYALNHRWSGKKRSSIVAIGRLSEEKDYVTLIDAFSIFHKSHSSSELIIFGEGPQRDYLTKYIVNCGLEGVVKMPGNSADAIAQAADCACYILTSVLEGMPNALLEAMAIGMPCISTNCKFGPEELIEDGVNGLLVPVGDKNALAQAMTKMIDDRDFAISCGKKAYDVKKEHSLSFVGKEYLDFINEIIVR